MTWFDLVVLTLVTFRVTRFTALDSLVAEPRDWIILWTLRAGSYHQGNDDWPVAWWRRKIKQFVECPWCQSVWVAAVVYVVWDQWGDTTGGRWALNILAVAGAAMIAFRYTDPAPPCLPTEKCE